MSWRKAPAIKSSQPTENSAPRIFWAGPQGGAPHFPSKEDFWLQHNQKISGPSHRLNEFGQAVCSATQRVWIIDKFFLGKPASAGATDEDDSVESALDYLCEALQESNVPSLRIITGARPEEARAALVSLRTARMKPAHDKMYHAEIQIAYVPRQEGSRGIRFVHDRFAIVDDMLWHFGATVGGVHWALNAASGPWNAGETKAQVFFEDLWRKCKYLE